jgi:hypothetical protein
MGFLIRERGDRQGERPDLSGDRRYRRPQLLLVVARVTLHLDESADHAISHRLTAGCLQTTRVADQYGVEFHGLKAVR